MPLTGNLSFLAIFGDAGIGMVWGWLVALAVRQSQRPLRTSWKLGLATLAVAAEASWFSNARGGLVFVAAMGLAFLLQIAWIWELNRHYRVTRS